MVYTRKSGTRLKHDDDAGTWTNPLFDRGPDGEDIYTHQGLEYCSSTRPSKLYRIVSLGDLVRKLGQVRPQTQRPRKPRTYPRRRIHKKLQFLLIWHILFQAVQSRKFAVPTTTDARQEQQKYRPSRTRDNPLARALIPGSPASPSKSGCNSSERTQRQGSAQSSAHDISAHVSPPRQSSHRRGRERKRTDKSSSLVSACRQMMPDSSMFSSSFDGDNASSWSHSAAIDDPYLPLRQRYSLPGTLSSPNAINNCIARAHKPEPSPPKPPCDTSTPRSTCMRCTLHSSSPERDTQEVPPNPVAPEDSPPSSPVSRQERRRHWAMTAALQQLPPRASRTCHALGDSAPLSRNARCDVWTRAHAAGVWHGRALATMSQLTQDWSSLRTVLEMQRPSPSPSPTRGSHGRGSHGSRGVPDAISMALDNLTHSAALPPLVPAVDSGCSAHVLTGAAAGVLMDSGMPSSILPDGSLCSRLLDSAGPGPVRKRSKTGCVGAIDALKAAGQVLPPPRQAVSQASTASHRTSGASGSSHRGVCGWQSSSGGVRGSREGFGGVRTVEPFDPHACLPTETICSQISPRMLHYAESTLSTTDVPTPTVSQLSHLSPQNVGGSRTEASLSASPRWLSGPAGGPAMFGTSPPPAAHCLASADAAESATSMPEIPWAQSANASQLTSIDTPLEMGGYQSSARALSSSCGPSLFDTGPASVPHVPLQAPPARPGVRHAVRPPPHVSGASVALQDTASSAVSIARARLAPARQDPLHEPAALRAAPGRTGTIVRAAGAVHGSAAASAQAAGAGAIAPGQPAEQADWCSAAAVVATRARPAGSSGGARPLSSAGMQAAAAHMGSPQIMALRRVPEVACLQPQVEVCRPHTTGSVASLRGGELASRRSAHVGGQAAGPVGGGTRHSQPAAPLLSRASREGCSAEKGRPRDLKGTVYSWAIARQADQQSSRAQSDSLRLPLLKAGSDTSASLRRSGADWGVQSLTLGTVSEQLDVVSGGTARFQAGRQSSRSTGLPHAHDRRRNHNLMPRPAASTPSESSEGSACRCGRSMPPHDLHSFADIERLVLPLPQKPRAVSYGPQHSARRATVASRQRGGSASEAWGRPSGRQSTADGEGPPRQTAPVAGRGSPAGARRPAKGAWR